jgi:hypothetical protein
MTPENRLDLVRIYAVKTDSWDVNEPGFIEIDRVAHCGNSGDGEFILQSTRKVPGKPGISFIAMGVYNPCNTKQNVERSHNTAAAHGI